MGRALHEGAARGEAAGEAQALAADLAAQLQGALRELRESHTEVQGLESQVGGAWGSLPRVCWPHGTPWQSMTAVWRPS